ncbi:hypothetical protein HYT95_02830, partial [Candidatus Peregrinibacteria bacterium]|nr:hypothetical protein [Candidatus Peregrinibacteria bacterium]
SRRIHAIRILTDPLPHSLCGIWIIEAQPEDIAEFCCGLDRRIASVVGPIVEQEKRASMRRP